MTLTETRNFMERIKLHYQEFMIDNAKVEEWHRELKDYNTYEVNDKFEEHLRNEQYGHQIPKVAFLTKYLIKISEKSKYNPSNLILRCGICGKSVPYNDYDKHITRCNSVEYLNLQSQRLYDKEIDKDKYRNMDDETFDKIYDKVLNKILEITNDSEEKQNIMNYFLGV